MKYSYELEFIKSVLVEQAIKAALKYYEAEADVRDVMDSGEVAEMSGSERRGLFQRVENAQLDHARLERAIHMVDDLMQAAGVQVMEPEERTQLFADGVPF